MDMRTIKAGIIGTGFIGPAHIEAARRLGFVEVVALAEADPEIAERKAKQLGIPRYYGDYREMLEKEKEVEVIHNCTPNYLHYAISKDCLHAGKHLISEKPLAMNSQESKELVLLAQEKGLVNAVDFNYRHYPLVQQARAMVEKGEVGKIYGVFGTYEQDWLYLDTDYNWRIEPELGGESRAVADIGTHWCDTAQFITGLKIKEVFADMEIIHKTRKKPKRPIETYAGKELTPEDYEEVPVSTEDYASVLLRFEGGAVGVFTVCQVFAGRKNRLYIEITGSKCALVWDQEDPERLWIGRREAPNQVLMRDPSLLHKEAKDYCHYPGGHPEGYPDGLKNFLRNVYRYIAEGKDPRKDPCDFPTFKDGHYEILMVEAVLKSAREKRWVEINYDI
jgi:predicted dehydrogenase